MTDTYVVVIGPQGQASGPLPEDEARWFIEDTYPEGREQCQVIAFERREDALQRHAEFLGALP